MANIRDDASELGLQDVFKSAAKSVSPRAGGSGDNVADSRDDGDVASKRSGKGGIIAADQSTAKGWGKGPRPYDTRKFAYDRSRVHVTSTRMNVGASKADRLDTDEAGKILANIHEKFGIDKDDESVLHGFDDALFLQHYLNGASIMQPGGGTLRVGDTEYDISATLQMIGEERLRKFFRVFANEVAETIRHILDTYDPYDVEADEVVGQIRQVAAERGMIRYPEYAADSADACTGIAQDLRRAIMASKAMVLPVADVSSVHAEAGALRRAGSQN